MFSEIIVCSLVYIAIVAIAYCPKNTTVTMPETVGYMDYFPESNTAPETLTPSSESLESSEVAIASNLQSLSIRALKKLASEKKVPRYSNLTKSQLIAAIA